MRTNGHLQYLTQTESNFNEDGEPIMGVSSWSSPVSCSIKTVTNNSNGRYEDGKFNQASYEVLVENEQIPLDTNRVRLYRYDVELGEFVVQGKPTPTSMDRVKIIV
jgi:hypothetical protein